MDVDKFNDWLHTLSDSFSVNQVLVIARKKCKWVWTSPQDLMSFKGSLAFLCQMKISSLQLEGVFEVSEDSIKATLTINQSSKSTAEIRAMQGIDGALTDLTDWLQKSSKVPLGSDLISVLKKATDPSDGMLNGRSILPRRIELALALDDQGKITKVENVLSQIEGLFDCGKN